MRVLLALLALVGLLISPIAASAAAPACLHHHDAAQMAAMMGMAGPQDAGCPPSAPMRQIEGSV